MCMYTGSVLANKCEVEVIGEGENISNLVGQISLDRRSPKIIKCVK